MAVTSGKVANLKVSKNFDVAYFWIEEKDTGTPELFILWETPAVPYDYIYHSVWLSMLRDAIAYDLPVEIGHDDDSAIVVEVVIARSTN
jgi:hypothetical protein